VIYGRGEGPTDEQQHHSGGEKYPFVEDERALNEFSSNGTRNVAETNLTHAAHVAVATCLAHEHAPDAALELTRPGSSTTTIVWHGEYGE
jgi:hypothetical protein